ncbi:MAG: hypothetical protein ACLQUT_04055 [Thermoleophilia bacterium]
MTAHDRFGAYRFFFVSAALICVGGLVIMGLFTVFFAWADSSSATAASTSASAAVMNSSYNIADSYGTTGLPQLTVTPTAATPAFIANPLKAHRGVVLLVYCAGAADDDQMLGFFNQVKAKYAAASSFFSFEAHDVNTLGDVLGQLHAYNPPMLAVIDGQGRVEELYTGWIDEQTLDQRISNAINNGF